MIPPLGVFVMQDDGRVPISPAAWGQFIQPVLIAAVLGAGASALYLWRDAPMSAAQSAQTSADVVQLKSDVAALQRSQIVFESQMAQLREMLYEIKQYNGATMRSVNEVNIQLAEIKVKLADPNFTHPQQIMPAKGKK